MKPAISMTTTILVWVLAAGMASAQSPSIMQSTRATASGVSKSATAASNEALGIHPSAAAAAKSKQAATNPSGVAATAPVKSSSSAKARAAGTGSVGVKSGGAAKRVAVVAAKHSAHAKATAAAPVPKTNPPAEAAAAGNGEGESAGNEAKPAPDSKYGANGRRDPFLSPVVSHAGGSGCSTGKKCLEIGTINLRGVVHAESGFIAVVSNNMNKAYFLRENDPVFNGYVVKITGDSIVFQETLQDRLGKSFTREVVKKITTPAV
jgi:hypothetical protein